MSRAKSIPALLAVVAIGMFGADSAIGAGPYPIEIKVVKAKPTKVKGLLIGARDRCADKVSVRIIGKGRLRAKARTNRIGIFRITPKPKLKAGRSYRTVVQKTTNANGETRCERALTKFKVTRSGATSGGKNGSLVFGGLTLDSSSPTPSVQVYSLKPGAAPVKLTTTSGAVWHECPSWSADGRLIYFDRDDRGNPAAPAHIYRVEATGGSPQLSDDPNAPTHLCPTVNWTGRWVTAIQYGDDGNGSIIRMRTDGSDRRAVARSGKLQDVFSPHFAPGSSRRILFSRLTYKTGGDGIKRSDLVVVNRSGRKRNITKRNDARFISPSWSPNGSRILAVRGTAENEIVRMNAKGGNVRRLAKVKGAYVNLSDPTYSPDGSKIAYVRCKGDCGDGQGAGSIWVMDADGSNRKRILAQASSGVQPAAGLDWGIRPPSP